MTVSNIIGMAVLVCLVVAFAVIYRRLRAQVRDAEGLMGVCRASELTVEPYRHDETAGDIAAVLGEEKELR